MLRAYYVTSGKLLDTSVPISSSENGQNISHKAVVEIKWVNSYNALWTAPSTQWILNNCSYDDNNDDDDDNDSDDLKNE